MRIDRIELTNFKKYAEHSFDLHPHFTLFIGDNASGKTTVLDAVAVALGVWLVDVPDTRIARRNILPSEIHLKPEVKPERIQFVECKPVSVRAIGSVAGLSRASWTRMIRQTGKRTTNAEANDVLIAISSLYHRDAAGEPVLFPVIAYYGAGRAWLPSNSPGEKVKEGPARRWNAFYDCLYERIRFADLIEWFKREAIAAGSEGGQLRSGFHVVRQAVSQCFPGLDGLRFDADRDEPVLSIDGRECPLSNLSAGQRMMFALVADLAIKTVTQNAHLLVKGLEREAPDKPWPTRDTPGVVLIDELDVHLHPKWQRRVASDLKRTFPKIQFVCTSHSPQVIGEVPPAEIRVLRVNEPSSDQRYRIADFSAEEADESGLSSASSLSPSVSFGTDANWILDHVMDAASRNKTASALVHTAESAMGRDDLGAAKKALEELRALMRGEDGELVRLESSLETLETLARADDQ